jgi:hypothetical protein
VSDQEIQDIVITANLTPRKCLGFKTPFQAILKRAWQRRANPVHVKLCCTWLSSVDSTDFARRSVHRFPRAAARSRRYRVPLLLPRQLARSWVVRSGSATARSFRRSSLLMAWARRLVMVRLTVTGQFRTRVRVCCRPSPPPPHGPPRARLDS